MATRTRLIFPVLLGIFFAFPASAQDLFFYPSQGQTQDQLNLDKFECHTWAVQQTGFDPSNPSTAVTAAPPPQAAPQGGLLRGAARGATVGVVGGAIAGDAGKGAGIGAASGALIGGFRRQDQLRRQQQAQMNYQQQRAAAASQQRANYNRAMGACMSSRGYGVS